MCMSFKAKLLIGVGAVALIASMGSLQARADEVSEAILKRLDALEKENGKLRAEIKQIEARTTAKAAPAKQAEAGLSPEVAPSKAASTSSSSTEGASSSYMLQTAGAGYIASNDGGYFQKKPGDSLTFRTPNGEITGYGNFDISLDATTKGISKGMVGNGGPVITLSAILAGCLRCQPICPIWASAASRTSVISRSSSSIS